MKKSWIVILPFLLVQGPRSIYAAPPVLNATASTLSGVAPLGVFFDATNTTSNVASDTFTEIEYEWNFDDAGAGNWTLTSLPKNTARGAMGFHVFESPGTYQVQLTARDAQGGSTIQNFTINVTDPNVIFSGANTVCFSPTDFVGCPAGAQQVTTNQWGTLQSHMASGKRLLLRRGATFTAASGLYMSADGPGDISAFGSGARPIIQAQGATLPITQPWLDASIDWRVRGLEFRGSYPSNPTPGNGIEFGNRWLVQNNVITSFQYGAIAAGFSRNDIYFVENDVVDNKHLGTYISGMSPNTAIFGNRFRCPTTSASTSLLRTYVKKVVMSHNQFDEIGGAGSHQIKFCGGSVADPSRYSIVSSNIFNDPASPNSWMVSVGPENNDPTSTQPVVDFIFERNIVRAPTTNSLGLQSRGASRVTVRNNIFHNTTGINMSIPVPGFSAWDRWHILNNVFYNTTTGGYVLNTDQPLTNVRVENNVVSFPNVTSAANANLITLSATPRSQITDSHNTWYVPQVALSGNVFRSQEGSYSRQNWTSQTCANGVSCGQSTLTDDPQFQNPSAGDFHLQSGSPSLDSGVSLAAVLSDFAGDLRTGVSDRGIFNGGAGGGGGPSGPQCSDGIDNDGDGLVDWHYDLGCSGANDTNEAAEARSLEDGWTTFDLANDAEVIFVSNAGNDTNCQSYSKTELQNLAPTYSGLVPCATINRGLQLMNGLGNNRPDWLLLRRGDTWSGGSGLTSKSGRSASEPSVIGSYGPSTSRPILQGLGYSFVSGTLNYAALTGIHFNSPSGDGISISFSGTSLLVEGNAVQSPSYSGIVVVEDGTVSDVQLRRNTIKHTNTNMIFMYGVNPALIEENILNNFNPATTFAHHGMYLDHGGYGGNITVRGNIVSTGRDAGNGIMNRPGGDIEDNFVTNFGWTGIVSASCVGACGPDSPPAVSRVNRNVVVGARSTALLGFGITIGDVNQVVLPGSEAKDNIVANAPLSVGWFPLSIRNDVDSFTMEGNVIYNWGQGKVAIPGVGAMAPSNFVFRNNQIQNHISAQPLIQIDDLASMTGAQIQGNTWYSALQSAGSWFTVPQNYSFAQWQQATGETGSVTNVSYAAPTRSMASYAASLGLAASDDAFLDRAFLQSRLNWNSQYTAYALNNYIRAGFNLGPSLPTNSAPTVNAGANQTISAPVGSVTLAGNVTDDGFPNPPAQTTSVWSRVSGPGVVTFGNTASPSTMATFSEPGTYVLRLTVNDGELSAWDDVQITVNGETTTGGGEPGGNGAVTDTRLIPCSNPKDSSERNSIPVCFSLKDAGNVSVTVWVPRTGKKVRELFNGHRDAGESRLMWDVKDELGNAVASGSYVVMFESAGIQQKIKVGVIR